MNDVRVERTIGGLGRVLDATDGISGLVCTGVATMGCQYGVAYKLQSVDDAIAMGITAEYDTEESVLVYEHIKEFYRMKPNETLWFMMVSMVKTVGEDDDVPTEYIDLVDPVFANSALKLLTAANGVINQLGVVYNTLDNSYTYTLANVVTKAKTLEVAAFNAHMPVVILLEGYNVTPSTAPDLTGLDSAGVAVIIAQDKSVADEEIYVRRKYYAAVGTVLGALSKAAVNINIGWVQEFNLLGDTLLFASLRGLGLDSYSNSVFETLQDKGFVFFRKHVGLSGIYLNDTNTATALTNDYLYLENCRTVNKAARIARIATINDLNGPLKIGTDGKIDIVTINSLQQKGIKAITDGMLKNEEISSFTYSINPDQDVLSTSNLEAVLQLVPYGTGRNITIKLGLINPNNA
jgi:hypothetical protein